MDCSLMLTITVFLSLNVIMAQTEYPKSDELTLRNQLLADVYFLKEGVDRLLVSSDILNKRFSNQMDILKKLLETKKNYESLDSAEDKNSCDKITGMFNATLKRQNILQNSLLVKLEELQDDQSTHFEEMLLTQKLNKNCGCPTVSSSTLSVLATTLTEVVEKVDQFEGKITKLSLLNEIIKAQEKKFDNFAEKHMKILEQVSDKLNNNKEQFDQINQKLATLKELNTDFKKSVTHPRPKLPMEVILGLTSANVTKHFK